MPESNVAQWDASVLRAVTNAARRSYRAHRGYMEMDDLQQEGYLWVAEHPDIVTEWSMDGSREALGKLTFSLYRHMHQATMKERYRRTGSEPGDHFRYPISVIAELLPEVLDGPDAIDSSPSDLNGLIRANKPLSERGDRVAMVIDVAVGFDALSDEDKYLLREKYGNGGVTDEVLGIATDTPTRTVNYHVTRALRRIADQLGGEPFEGRRAVSNARAQFETRGQE